MAPPERAGTLYSRGWRKRDPGHRRSAAGSRMLGTSLSDPHGVEVRRNDARHGAPADPHDLCGEEDEGRDVNVNGSRVFSNDGVPVKINGYEIHMGETIRTRDSRFRGSQYENGENIAAVWRRIPMHVQGYKTDSNPNGAPAGGKEDGCHQRKRIRNLCPRSIRHRRDACMRSAISSQREKVFVRIHMKTGKHSRWQSIKKSSMTRWPKIIRENLDMDMIYRILERKDVR